MAGALAIRGVVVVACLAFPAVASAERPALAGEASYGVTGGDILVHYATTGVDAAPTADGNGDGVPDFVAEVATTAEQALDHFLALGYRRPLADGALGGDNRIDIYLADLIGADGSAPSDSCTANRCIGFAVAENDYAGYSYSSITEAIRSVVPHELFHLIQNTYSNAQPASWSEASAVWAVENLYGTGNNDFERFLPSFVTRSYRPFERPSGGFGDAYPYGAALWPYFLEKRFSASVVRAAWEASETQVFLGAFEAALGPQGSSVDAAWTEMTRWNLFTGPRAALGRYPATAVSWPVVPFEAPISDQGKIFIEGLSARYVPITLAARDQVTVSPTGGIRVVAWLVPDGAGLDGGIELSGSPTELAAEVDAGSYMLVVTGLQRMIIATAVNITVGDPPPNDDDGDDDGGGCTTSPSSGTTSLVLVAGMLLRRRRRRG